MSGGTDALLTSADDLLSGAAEGTSDQDWNYDPSEPRYCICNQVGPPTLFLCMMKFCVFKVDQIQSKTDIFFLLFSSGFLRRHGGM